MTLNAEIENARKDIVSDGYEMSLGEVINLYKDTELKINPEFQRLFRWDITRKTRFIESILLSIPIPPIFVFQDDDGNWELIDGLQRLSTVLEFTGNLIGSDGKAVDPSALEGTKFLPSLADMHWQTWKEGDKSIDKALQLQIRRARIRVEILLKESDVNAKFELFQRLNTGGANLSPQEVRNCVAVMVNPEYYTMLKTLAIDPSFQTTTAQTENAIEKQANVELVLRFFAFRNHPYVPGLDVHEYLDEALIEMAEPDSAVDWEAESKCFKTTFSMLNDALSDNAFKRWDGASFSGKFLMSMFETVAFGISQNLDGLKNMENEDATSFIVDRSKQLWSDVDFTNNSGAGVRGTTRLAKLLPMAVEKFKP